MSSRAKFLKKVTKRWLGVCQENEDHRDLVTESEWSQWEEFRNSESETLKEILASDSISDGDMKFLEDMGNRIDNAQRMSRKELVKRQEEELDKSEREELSAELDKF